MLVRHIDDLENPHLDPYRELKRSNLTRWSKWFIAEGRLVVERLLASSLTVFSVLLAEKRFSTFGPQIPEGIETLVVPDELANQLVGFDFHTGIMACGLRPAKQPSLVQPPTGQQTWVVCPNINLPDNLGAIVRHAAAFGAEAVVVGPQSADPFSRRVVRVSMGNLFRLAVHEPRNLLEHLLHLRDAHDFQLVAANLSERAVDLRTWNRPSRLALILGNEKDGVPPDILAVCNQELQIPIASEIDSLNVSTAAAIMLYELSRQ